MCFLTFIIACRSFQPINFLLNFFLQFFQRIRNKHIILSFLPNPNFANFKKTSVIYVSKNSSLHPCSGFLCSNFTKQLKSLPSADTQKRDTGTLGSFYDHSFALFSTSSYVVHPLWWRKREKDHEKVRGIKMGRRSRCMQKRKYWNFQESFSRQEKYTKQLFSEIVFFADASFALIFFQFFNAHFI